MNHMIRGRVAFAVARATRTSSLAPAQSLAGLRFASSSTSPSQEWGSEEWRPVERFTWTKEQLEAVEQTHVVPKARWDHAALFGTKLVRLFFDVGSGYSFGKITEAKLLRRIVFLETVAGIPGMVAGSLRHLRSLRRIERDMGWIQTLLDEAENERMHLMVFQELANPSLLMKATVTVSQIVAWNAFFAFYLIAPTSCHRFVGYVEEEAVHTYTGALELLASGGLPEWENMACPPAGIEYWGLPKDAKMYDLLLAVRADEAHHRDVNDPHLDNFYDLFQVNHMFADMKESDPNPLIPRNLPPSP